MHISCRGLSFDALNKPRGSCSSAAGPLLPKNRGPKFDPVGAQGPRGKYWCGPLAFGDLVSLFTLQLDEYEPNAFNAI